VSRAKVLECQSCGEVVRTLSEDEALTVASRPYDFVVYCRAHKADAIEEAFR